MAAPSQHQNENAHSEAGDAAFLDQAYLTYIIPFGTDVDIEAEVRNAKSRQMPLEDIESRSWLFFGKASTRAVMLPLLPCRSPEILVSHNTHS